jgi:hypothetical protein
MKTIQPAAGKAQEPKRETQQQDTYRAPRLVHLGTAVGLVQGGLGLYRDSSSTIQGRHG